jgi:hypothetical protein
LEKGRYGRWHRGNLKNRELCMQEFLCKKGIDYEIKDEHINL